MTLKWTPENRKKLLSCKTDEAMMALFPGKNIQSLNRKKREFKQYGATELTIDKQDLLKENFQLKSKSDFFSFVGDAILNKIKPFDAIPSNFKKTLPYNEEDTLVALLSDEQVGERTGSEEMGNLGEYNISIFKDRLWNWARGITYINYNNNGTLHIDALGDDLDNIAIYKGQAHHIEAGLAKQFILTYEELSKVFAFLLEHFKNIVVNKVVGNHGRYGMKGENPIMDNVEYLLYKMIEKQFANNDRIRFNISESWWMVVERMGWRSLLTHGDTFNSWLGIPFYGAIRNRQRMDDLLSGSFKDAHFDFVEHGHFHTYASFNNIFMNGCFPGVNEFSSRLGLGGTPMQLVLGMSKTYGVRWQHPLYLTKPNDKPKMKIYS